MLTTDHQSFVDHIINLLKNLAGDIAHHQFEWTVLLVTNNIVNLSLIKQLRARSRNTSSSKTIVEIIMSKYITTTP